MRCRILFVLVCVALSRPCLARNAARQGAAITQTPKPTTTADLTNLLDAKIKAEWEAIKKKDGNALGNLLDEEYVAVEADGSGERYKWQILRELERSAVTDSTLSFLKVTPLCADAAFVRYEAFLKFPPQSLVKFEKILIGEIWVRRKGDWKSLHYQETRVK